MRFIRSTAILLCLGAAPCLLAQTPPSERDNPATWSSTQTADIVQAVRSKLSGLARYSVFDYLHFAIRGRTLILEGYASRPNLKSDAANAGKGIAGVQTVENQIKVLPPSIFDDRIRVGVYRRIYTNPMLRRYTGSPVGFGRFPSVAMAAGGITQDPPRGYHAIHIIVDRGNVILKGVVDSEAAANVAGIQANLTPGVFSVDNDLLVSHPEKSEKE